MKDFGVIIAINLVIGLSIPSIDVSAHIGGLVVGFIGGFVLSKNPKWLLAYNIMMILVIMAFASYLPNQYAQTLF
jgi:rhomboid protease GluP